MRNVVRSIIPVLFAALLAIGCGATAEPEPTPTPTPDALLAALAAYAPPTLAYEKLGARLDRMVAEDAGGQTEEVQEGEDHSDEKPSPHPMLVKVDIAISEDAGRVFEFLENNGVEPSYVGYDVISATVPVSMLPELSRQEGVVLVREAAKPSSTR